MVYSHFKLKKLVLVESPAKAKTIQSYLGSEFYVIATGGHILDLPKLELGVNIQDDFKITKQIIPKALKKIPQLTKEIDSSSIIYVATDPDREGEAIAFDIRSLAKNLNKAKWYRTGFHEITKSAVLDKINSPDAFNDNLALSQETRRVLDRLFGYLISPVLWKKIQSGLSAGRVQSVLLRWICEREKEIQNFQAETFYEINAIHNLNGASQIPSQTKEDSHLKINFTYIFEKDNKIFPDQLFSKWKIEKPDDSINWSVDELFTVKERTSEDSLEYPKPAYQTSTLQEYCANRFHFPPKKTMSIAQKLFEGIDIGNGMREGLITYPRTDSNRLSQKSIKLAQELIAKLYGKEYVGSYRSTKQNKIQDAHEAIRPTQIGLMPDKLKSFLSPDEWKVYDSIHRRFLSSLAAARKGYKIKTILSGLDSLWERNDFQETFDGYRRLESSKEASSKLIQFKVGQKVSISEFSIELKETQGPSRYTYASLIKKMEKTRVGRPSTYSQSIETLNERKYILWEKRTCFPTDLGMKVNQFLVTSFGNFILDDFTKNLEEELDEIQLGNKNKTEVLKLFYKELRTKLDGIPKGKLLQEAKKTCPICKSGTVQNKRDRKGKTILFCSRYPECDYGEYQ
jgi:DNA topoisomerase I